MLDFYKGKKVLVTGHTGFKGGWLSLWLESLGAKVIGYSLDPDFDNGIYELSGLKDRITDYRGDIRDLERVKEVFLKEQPEMVFHLAAQPLVLESYNNPVETYEVNVQGTVHILEATRMTPSVKAGVFITTDKCYENKEWHWGYRETDLLGGHDPYSASKAAAEIVINSYRNSFFNTDNTAFIASARAGNVIGGGDWSANRIVPDIIRAILKGETLEVRNPSAVRPWQHVLDPLGGYLKLGVKLFKEREKYAEPWNFGPYINGNSPVKDLVEQAIAIIGKGDWVDTSNGKKPHETNLLLLDISKSIQKLGWQPVLDFRGTLDFTSAWYLDHHNGEDMEKVSKNQIEEYQAKWMQINAG